MFQRSLLYLPVTLLAISALAGPAFAGSDSDDENGGPVPTPAPFVQPPDSVPVDTAVPTPAPVTPAPVTPAPIESGGTRERVRHAKRSRRRVAARRTHTRPARRTRVFAARRTPTATAHVVAVRHAVPRGGVQAGAGGTALGLPLGMPTAADLLRFTTA